MGGNWLEKRPVEPKNPSGRGSRNQWVASPSSPASRPALSADCKFTCHYRCRALVCLDCCGPRDLGWDSALERDTNVVSAGSGEGGPGREAGAQRRCPGLIRTPCTMNIPMISFLASETPVLLAGLSGADSTPNLQPTNHGPRRRALARCTRTSHTPASGPEARSLHMRTRRGPRGGAELRCLCGEVIPRAVAWCPRPATSPPSPP